MKCVKLPQSNIYLGPAPGDEDRVYGIDAVQTDIGIVTAWKLEPEELAEFMQTGIVYIAQCGHGFNPMMVRATNPFGEIPQLPREDIILPEKKIITEL